MLKEHLWRYLGVLILIIIGSWTFVVVTGLTQDLDDSATVFAEEHVQEDLFFATDKVIPDIGEWEKETNAIIEDYLSVDAALSDSLTLRLLSKTEKVNIPAVIEGRALSGPGEILLDPAFARANGYPVGSQIEAAGKTFTVVGFMALPQYIYPLQGVNDLVALPDSFGLGVVSREEFADIQNADTNYSVKFNDRTQSLNLQTVQLRERLQAEGITTSDWTPATNNKRMRIVETAVSSYEAMSAPLSVAMFLLSCLIIGIMIWRMIRQEAVIIGTFYAQGYRRRELMRHYMAIPLLLAFLGGVIGSLLALPCITPSVKVITLSYIMPVTSIESGFWSALISILMPVALLGISSYLVTHSELKRPPAELMKGNKEKSKVNTLERVFKLDRLKFSTKFKLREQLRSISRLLFLLLGVTSASALMLFGFMIASSYSYMFRDSGADIYRFEYEYAFRDLQSGKAPEGAEVFNNGRFYPESNEAIEFYVTAIEPDSTFLTLDDSKGNLLPNDQTNITQGLADRLGIKAGDTVSFINKQDGKAYTFHIDATANYAGQLIYMPIDEFNEKLEYPENSYIGLWSGTKLDIPGDQLSGAKTMSEIASSIDAMLRPLIYSMATMIFVACVVALIILYLVTSLIIEENKSTISLFKIFGYKRREIKSLVLNSSTYVVLIGFIISIPIMLASMGALYDYIGSMTNIVFPKIMNPLYVLVCFVLIMLTYQFSKLLCAKQVNAVSMSEALKAGTE
ncbi:MAG: FtsX-like permease family protein [Dehalobacterium sp.]